MIVDPRICTLRENLVTPKEYITLSHVLANISGRDVVPEGLKLNRGCDVCGSWAVGCATMIMVGPIGSLQVGCEMRDPVLFLNAAKARTR